MQVFGIGNVKGCNSSCIHLNDEGKQHSIKSTTELLTSIVETALENIQFYDRMAEELKAVYEKRKVEVEKRYKWITDDMIKEAMESDRKAGLSLSWSKDTHNEECVRQHNKVQGIYEGVIYARDNYFEAKKLLSQAKTVLNWRKA